MALTYDEANSVSSKFLDKGKWTDQVYDEHPLLDKMKKGGRVIVDGGNTIKHTIRYRELGLAKSVDPGDARDTVVKEVFTSLEFNWKYNVVDQGITWDEAATNSGEHKIIDLLSGRYTTATDDMNKHISTLLYQAQASIGGEDMEGVMEAIQTTASDTSYGGISSGDAASWIAGLYDATTATLALYGAGSLDAGLRACRFNDYPDLMVTTYANNSIYASKLQPGERRSPGESDAGAVDNYFQKKPILTDPQCPANTWLFLNTKELYMYVHPDYNFKLSSFEEDPSRYNAMRFFMSVMGNFVIQKRRNFGAYTAISS